jgi:NAD(P)-dependent dehydrogenase (short-subunit alcohol dehydrogenase family)
MNLFGLDGKVALVTGAGSGLGRQFSEVMAEAGADVACADIDEESARATAAVVQGLGGLRHVHHHGRACAAGGLQRRAQLRDRGDVDLGSHGHDHRQRQVFPAVRSD